MGQFLRAPGKARPRVSSPIRTQPVQTFAATPFPPPPRAPVPPRGAIPAFPALSAEPIAQRLGIFCAGFYLVAPAINDLTLRLFDITLNIGLIFGSAAAIALFLSGNIFSFLSSSTGRAALAFLFFAALSVTTSYWPTDSFTALQLYATRTFVTLLFIPAFVSSTAQMRRFLNTFGAGLCVFLVTCIFFARPSVDHGRLVIQGSPYYENPNDLGNQLILAVPFLLYWVSQGKWALKVVALFGTALSLWFLLQTASRGAFVGLLAFCAIRFLFGKQKLLVGALASVGLIFLFAVSSDAQRRLLLIFDSDQTVENDRGSGGIAEARASSKARMHLITRAVEMTVEHPITGVGIGQFAEVIWAEGKEVGVHETALGTHNSYLQVSSETGVFGFFFYVGVLVLCIRRFYVMFRNNSHSPESQELKAQSMCWFSAAVCYATVAMFHHIAFSSYFPLIGGACIAMELYSAKSRRLPPLRR